MLGEKNLQPQAVLLARILGYIDVLALNRDGKLYLPDLVRKLVERYEFKKSPQTIEEYDLTKGLEFLGGKSGSRPIQKLTIWTTLIVVETVSSTDESKAILEEIIKWAADHFKLPYAQVALRRFGYVSDVVFQSNAPILDVNPAIEKLATQVTSTLSEIWQEPIQYQPMTLKIGHDPQTRKFGIAPFWIERRADYRFSENMYFSEAPLPTDLHWKFLEQFEMDILMQKKAAQA